MFELPNSPFFGNLSLSEVYEFYDFPRLFTCANKSGQHFLVLSTFDDIDSFEWLYLPISTNRLALVLSGKTALRDAFLHAEDGYLLKVSESEFDDTVISHIFPEQIPSVDLPAPGARLNLKSTPLNQGLGPIDAHIAATASFRETYNLHLYPPGTERPELSSRALGNLLIDVQEMVDALGQRCRGEPTLKGAIAAEILHETRLDACQIFDGSFGLQLKGHQLADLFGKSLLNESFAELLNLFSIGADEDLISNKLHSLKGRVASKYRKLLKDLVSIGSPLKIEWGSPSSESGGEVAIDRETLFSAYEIVSKIEIEMSEEISFDGELLGMDVKTKHYRVSENATGSEYSGRVLDESILVESSNIHGRYHFTIKKLLEVNSASGSERTRWVLIGLQPIEK